MACFLPVQGYRAKKPNESGKYSIVFSPTTGVVDLPVSISCGRCIGCRLERSRQWAVRCVHEASMHDANAFVTLTFSEKFLAPSGSLVKLDFVRFMKRLRKWITRYQFDTVTGSYILRKRVIGSAGVRFYHCGEYGSVCVRCNLSVARCVCARFVGGIGRPHHHCILFGFDFQDKVLFKVTDGIRLFRSASLEQLWPFGFASVGEVTFESAAYVARYVVKKINGLPADAHYRGKLPEYTTMSRRPGIARTWFNTFKSDVFPGDQVVIRGGVKCRPPRYYGRVLSLTNPEEYELIIGQRSMAARKAERGVEPQRFGKVVPRIVKQEVLKMRLAQLKRGRVDD